MIDFVKGLRGVASVLLAVVLLAGVLSCSSAQMPDAQKRPAQVKVGMTADELEALMGKSEGTSLHYNRGGFHIIISYRQTGQVDWYQRTPLGVPMINVSPHESPVEAWGIGGVPIYRFPADYQRVAAMTPREIRAAFGTPVLVQEGYSVSGKGYYAKLVNGKVVEFDEVASPPPMPLIVSLRQAVLEAEPH